jgi:ubiquinone/menaquinone biosynthesis C-methylase UbiE
VRGLEQIPWLYDAMLAVAEWGGLASWRRWLVSAARGRALDVGCGTGRDLPLYPAGVRAVAMDPHPQNLARARRRAPNVPLVRARAEALPFRDGSFDTVVSGLVFCSVSDPARGLAEVRRVLAAGGALRMLEHVRARGRLRGRLQDLLQPAWTFVAGGCHPNRDTEASVEAAGFRIEDEGRRARDHMRRFQARPRWPAGT